jgi:exodeoxyribonuclease V alpha subunit
MSRRAEPQPPAQDEQRPPWVAALVAGLAEALPRLHGCSTDPAVQLAMEALTIALADGELEVSLDGPVAAAVAASPLTQGEWSPLVLEGQRLLWRRWQHQRNQVLNALIARAGQASGPGAAAGSDALVQRHGAGLDREQQRAVAAVLQQRLVLLEGGPGTGKTSTVARMLAARRQRDPACRIALAAPTGKAAARLRAAIAAAHPDLPCSTLHRLLESRGSRFGRHRQNPLELDLLVVDELSMVDLPLMQALLEALPEACGLVLVGDAAQLPPVGTGAVLLELQRPERREALGPAAVRLSTTYRNNGAIAAVAGWLRQGLEGQTTAAQPASAPDSAGPAPLPLTSALTAHLRQLPADANLRWHPASPLRLPPALLTRLREHQQRLAHLAMASTLAAQGPAPLLAELEHCLVLSPRRSGRWGIEAVHRELLGERAQLPAQHWPIGTPVLCGQNQSDLGLANGDLGVVVEQGGERRLLFAPAGLDSAQWLHPAQLRQLQPALALTVHKAQGSEAEEVWVLLPSSDRPMERLLYTALTRAQRQAHLITPA